MSDCFDCDQAQDDIRDFVGQIKALEARNALLEKVAEAAKLHCDNEDAKHFCTTAWIRDCLRVILPPHPQRKEDRAMSEQVVKVFEREQRYFVLKLSDRVNARHLTDYVTDDLSDIGREFENGRARAGKKPLECVVVESDWPEYEIVWGLIQARVEGRPNLITTLKQRIAELEAAQAWIPVSERLPDESRPEVVFCLTDDTTVCFGKYAPEVERWYQAYVTAGDGFRTSAVRCWKPILPPTAQGEPSGKGVGG